LFYYTIHFYRFTLICIGLLFVAQISHAQIFSNNPVGNTMSSDQKIISDSNSKKQITTDDKIQLSYTKANDTTNITPDTTISLLHRNPLLSIWDVDLGNLASASNSLYFSPDLNPSLQLGLRSIRPYLKTWDSLKFYNTTRPYTDLYFRIGGKQEQMIKLLHTQNITPSWNIAVEYQKIGSPGYYKLQRTNHDHLTLNTQYKSNNLRYEAKAALLYNKIQQDENMGILDERFLSDANYNDKRLVPVKTINSNEGTNRSSVTNYYRNLSLNLQQQYFIGKADSVLSEDSTEKKYTFKPYFGIKHRFYADYSFYRFKNLNPDSTQLEIPLVTGDSLESKYLLGQVGNAFSLTGDIYFRGKLCQAEAGYGVELESPNNYGLNETYVNNYVFASIQKSASSAKEWMYNGTLKFYFTGNAIGNTLLQLQTGLNLAEKYGQIRTGLRFSIQSPSYLQTHIQSNYYLASTALNKQTITQVYLKYINVFRKTSIDFNYYTIGNFIYFENESLKAQQYSKIIPLFQVQLNKEIAINHFHLYNHIALQGLPPNPAIHVPIWTSRHTLSYENYIFKKKLQVATGIEARYNTGFYTDQYNPYLFGFAAQQNYTILNTPQLSCFFNFKVKRYRATIAFDELQQFYTRNNINFNGYAAQNAMLRFGFHWVFIN
jgi:hypothetical protein